MEPGGAGLDGVAVGGIAAIVVLSLLMVAAMVRFSRAFLARVEREARPGVPPDASADDSPIRRWGSVYGLAWLSLIAAFLWFMGELEGGWSGRNLGILALVAGAYWAAHAVLLWFAAALIRANLRGAPRPSGEGRSGMAAAGPATSRHAPSPAPSVRQRLLAFGRLLVALAVAFAFVAVGAAVPALRELEAWFDLHRGTLAPAAGAVAGVGWALLIGGAIHGVLTAGRDGSFSDAVSFREVKRAWRGRAWRRSRRWRRFFTMAAGAAMTTLGLFGLGVVLAPAGLKLLLAAALAYAAARTVLGMRRA